MVTHMLANNKLLAADLFGILAWNRLKTAIFMVSIQVLSLHRLRAAIIPTLDQSLETLFGDMLNDFLTLILFSTVRALGDAYRTLIHEVCSIAATGDELLTIGALHTHHRARFAHVVLVTTQLAFPLAAIVTTSDFRFHDNSVSLNALLVGPWFSATVWAL